MGCDLSCGHQMEPIPISIHAPRVGCDHLLRGLAPVGLIISIHAPRVGCDAIINHRPFRLRNFNPRTPCGVRLPSFLFLPLFLEFQSTHPVWGATPSSPTSTPPWTNFNPRTPCGVRPTGRFAHTGSAEFQSTHPVWGATESPLAPAADSYFNPRTPCGVRLSALSMAS